MTTQAGVSRRGFFGRLATVAAVGIAVPKFAAAPSAPSLPLVTGFVRPVPLQELTNVVARTIARALPQRMQCIAANHIGQWGMTNQLVWRHPMIGHEEDPPDTAMVAACFVDLIRRGGYTHNGVMESQFAGAECFVSNYEGVALRGIRQYQIQTDSFRTHFDMLVGRG